MRKRTTLILGIILALSLAFGFAFAEQKADPKIATGELVSVDLSAKAITVAGTGGNQEYPLATSVWVYKDEQKAAIEDLKPGDKVEISLNAKGQAAYIKAYSKEFLARAVNGQSGTVQNESKQTETAGKTVPAQAETGQTGNMNPSNLSTSAELAAINKLTGVTDGSVQLNLDPSQVKVKIQLKAKNEGHDNNNKDDDNEDEEKADLKEKHGKKKYGHGKGKYKKGDYNDGKHENYHKNDRDGDHDDDHDDDHDNDHDDDHDDHDDE